MVLPVKKKHRGFLWPWLCDPGNRLTQNRDFARSFLVQNPNRRNTAYENTSPHWVIQLWIQTLSKEAGEEGGGSVCVCGGGRLFLLALPAFLPSVISFFFFTQNKGEGRAPRDPPLDPPLGTYMPGIQGGELKQFRKRGNSQRQ